MVLWILAAVFSSVGLPMVWIGLHFIKRDRTIARWPRAQGVMISSSVEKSRSSPSRDKQGHYYSYEVYTPVVRYSYTVDGQLLEGDRVAREFDSTSRAPVQACVDRYASGKEVKVLYDPSDPKTAYLESRRSLGAVILLSFGGFWIALGTFLAALALLA